MISVRPSDDHVASRQIETPPTAWAANCHCLHDGIAPDARWHGAEIAPHQSFKKRYFARLWEETTIAVGLDKIVLSGFADSVSLHFHDLRGTTVTLFVRERLHPATNRDHRRPLAQDLASHKERYLARTRGLAEQAIFNWENSERTNFANQLQTGTSAPSEAKGKMVSWRARNDSNVRPPDS